MKYLMVLTLCGLAGVIGPVRGEDVFRFRGANSQGRYTETRLLDAWPEKGLTPRWINTELGGGWTSVVKVGDRLYVGGVDIDDKKRESVVCLDLDGRILWRSPAGKVWERSYPVARATPTYVPGDKPENDRLVVLSGGGELTCLNAADGALVWKKDMATAYETRAGHWGLAESVVVKDGVVFVTVCGKKALVAAVKVADGSEVWTTPSNGDENAYVTPALIGDQLIVMTARFVTGVNTADGRERWRADYRQTVGDARMHGINCNPPVVKGNRFFVAAGYDQGGVMYELQPDGNGVKTVWTSKVLDPHHDGAVEIDGRLYGSNWLNNGAGQWVCLDWETGETVYEEAWDKLGKGVTIFADGMMYLYEERRGHLGLAKPGDKFDVIARFPVTFGSKEHWAHPVISDGVLYVRRGNALAAFDIRQP